MVVVCLGLYSFINDSIVLKFSDNQDNNRVVYNLLSLYTIVEFIVYTAVIYWCLRMFKLKRIILFFSPLFILFSLYQLFSTSSINENSLSIDSLSITVENLILICFALLYFYEQLAEPQESFVYSSYRFWIILGILIYSTGTFFFFLQSDSLTDEQWDDWSLINYFCTILKIIFFSIAILMKKESSDNIYRKNPLLDDKFEKSLDIDPNNPD